MLAHRDRFDVESIADPVRSTVAPSIETCKSFPDNTLPVPERFQFDSNRSLQTNRVNATFCTLGGVGYRFCQATRR